MLQDISAIRSTSRVDDVSTYYSPPRRGERTTDVATVRARGVNYFANLRRDMSAMSTSHSNNEGATSAHGGGQHGDKKATFTESPSSVLPPSALRDLCLKHLATRLGQSSASIRDSSGFGNTSRQGRTRRELRMKLRAGVNAVVFANLLTHLRLRSIAKNLESHVCEPYRVLAAAHDMEELCGRAVCVFAVMVADNSGEEDALYFALDRAPLPTEGLEWRIVPVMPSDARVVSPQFVSSGGSNGPAKAGTVRLHDVVVVAEYDSVARQFVPVSVEHMRGQTNTYYQVLRDFEQTVNSITLSSLQEAQTVPDVPDIDGAPSRVTGTNTSPMQRSLPSSPITTTAQDPKGFGVPLPTYQEMQAMPPNILWAVQELALASLRRCFLPRLLLRQRRKQRERMSRSATAYPITVDQLLKLQTFEMWPPSLLDELIQALKPYVAERGEIILQEKEVPCNSIYFLTSGTVQQVQKIDRHIKGVLATNSKVLQPSVSSLSCFGQLSFISSDPRMTSVRANSLCTFWRLFRTDYFRVFSKLPSSVKTHVSDLAFQRRTQSVPYNLPLTLGLVRSMPVFSTCGEPALRALMALFRPISVPAGHILSTADGDGNVMHMLLRGRCGVFRTLRDRKEEAHVQSIGPTTMVGDDAVIGGGSHVTTTKTLTSCDLYTITKEDFESCMSRFGADWNAVVEQATRARQLRLLDSQDRFKEMAINIPIVSQILSFARRTELSRLFQPILYHPKQTVCCSAHFADRVIIVVEGTVRFQDGRVWECGEAAGYTCIVPHRWAQTATAVTSSKLIELRHHEYREFLDQHDALETVRNALHGLMFPKAAPAETVYWALLATQRLVNPPLYPISQSERITPCEPRFGVRVVSFGQQKVHRRGAPQPTSSLEIEVQRSMQSIHERVAKKHLQSSNASRTSSQLSSSANTSTDHSVTKEWSSSRLLLMKTRCGSAEVRGGPRNVDNHPIMREYRENYRKPTGFTRASYHALLQDIQ